MAVPFPHDKLPFPSQSSFKRSLARPFSRFEMDDGSSRTYRDFEAENQVIALSWDLTWEQFAYWEAWFEYDIGGGVAAFDMQLSPKFGVRTYSLTEEPPKVVFIERKNEWQVQLKVKTLREAPETRPLGFIARWPDSLPEPEKSGYSLETVDRPIFSDISEGLQESRVRFKEKVVLYKARWYLTLAELEVFEDFVLNDLAGGRAKFLAPFSNGLGLTLIKAKFKEPHEVSAVGAAFEVSAELETSAAPLLTEQEYRSL